MANEYPLDSNSFTKLIVSGGIQVEFPFLSNPLQIIYLDFDGELTKYRNADLDMEIDGVQVEDSKRIIRIAEKALLIRSDQSQGGLRSDCFCSWS